MIEELEFISFADKVAEVSKKVYSDFLNKVLELCLESAKEGNVFFVLDKTKIDFPYLNKDNVDVLVYYLINKGFKITIENDQIVVRWKHILLDEPIGSFVVDKPETYHDIVYYLRRMFAKINNEDKMKELVKLYEELYDTIINFENQYPGECSRLFGEGRFFKIFVEKLDELMSNPDALEYMPWAAETKIKIKKIGLKRGLIKDEPVESVAEPVVEPKDSTGLVDYLRIIYVKIDDKDITRTERAKLCGEMFTTIINFDDKYPTESNKLFYGGKFLKAAAEKLDEIISEYTPKYIPWAAEAKIKIKEIRIKYGLVE